MTEEGLLAATGVEEVGGEVDFIIEEDKLWSRLHNLLFLAKFCFKSNFRLNLRRFHEALRQSNFRTEKVWVCHPRIWSIYMTGWKLATGVLDFDPETALPGGNKCT
jgi:hypothetical protein